MILPMERRISRINGIRVRRALLGCVASLVLSLTAFRLHFNLSSATSAHLFLVVIIALRWGFLEASIASIVTVGCLDYFFTEPLFAFYISDSQDWVALITFEAAALLVSRLSDRVGLLGREAERQQARVQMLYEISQQFLLLDPTHDVGQELAMLLQRAIGARGVALWNSYDLRLAKSGDCDMNEEEVRAVFFAESNDDNLSRGTSSRNLRIGTKTIGALVIYDHPLDAKSIDAIAALSAIAIERARSFATESRAEAARLSEQLRSAILDGLAHAFKSPLTTIRVSSSGLLEMGTLSGTEQRLVTLIDKQATQLTDLSNHLLTTAKLDSGNLRLHREPINLDELLETLRESEAQDSVCEAQDSEETPAVNAPSQPGVTVAADRRLLSMALSQLLDNAYKYGSPSSSPRLSYKQGNEETVIMVTNEGSFIPADERDKVFRRFYRCASSAKTVAGSGIGLSVVRRIAEAHQGRAWVESDPAIGTTFAIALPRLKQEALA
jgi:two-component system sensor histidine kinase KdpD